jgi:hypothetical protein
VQKTPTQKRNERRKRAGTRNRRKKLFIDGDLKLTHSGVKRIEETNRAAEKLRDPESRWVTDDFGEVYRRRRKRLVCVETNPGPHTVKKQKKKSHASLDQSALQEDVRAMKADLVKIKAAVPSVDKDIKDGYFVIDKKVDVKHPDLKMALTAMGRNPRMRQMTTRLAVGTSATSAANTGLAYVFNIDPSASAEFASFATLFDEVKVHGGEIHYDFSSSGGTPTFVDTAGAYDPVDSSPYTNVVSVLVASQNTGPHKLESGLKTATLNGGEAVNRTGFWKYGFKCPEGTQVVPTNSAAATQVVTGQWAATAQTPMQYGFFKGYVQGGGTSVVVNMYIYIIMHVTFRSRT